MCCLMLRDYIHHLSINHPPPLPGSSSHYRDTWSGLRKRMMLQSYRPSSPHFESISFQSLFLQSLVPFLLRPNPHTSTFSMGSKSSLSLHLHPGSGLDLSGLEEEEVMFDRFFVNLQSHGSRSLSQPFLPVPSHPAASWPMKQRICCQK